MGRQTWATDEQVTWLSGHKKGFVEAQAESTTRTFFNSTLELYVQKWPVGDPTPTKLLDADGDVEKAKKGKLLKLRQRIEWWIHNRNRLNAMNGGKGKTPVLSLACKKVQMMTLYQAYMHLFPRRVMPQLKAAYQKYLENVKEGEKVRHFWSLVTEEGPRLLQDELDDVKEQVEEYRQHHYQEQIPTPITFEDLMKEGLVEGQKKVAALQNSINLLACTGLEALKAIEDQMGFKGTIILSGPNPETGRIVTLVIHHGSTTQLDNIWPEATDDWATVQKSFDSFITRCFPPELPTQLKKLFNGEVEDLPSETPTAGTPAATPVPSINAPPALPAIPALPASPTPDATTLPEALTSSTVQSPPNATLVDENSETADLTVAEQRNTPPLSYDDEIRACHSRNLRIWKAMEKFKVSADEAGKIVDEGGDLKVEEPEWIGEGRDHLLEASKEDWWWELIEAWCTLEAALKYPQGARHCLGTKFCPEEVKNWINRGQNYAKPSKIKTLAKFGDNVDAAWPLLRSAPRDDSEWSEVRKGSCNGIFMVLVCLSWWLHAVQDSGDVGNMADLRDAVEDVKWVLLQITPAGTVPKASTTSSVPITSSSPSSPPPPITSSSQPIVSESTPPSSESALSPSLAAPTVAEPPTSSSASSTPIPPPLVPTSIEATSPDVVASGSPAPVPPSARSDTDGPSPLPVGVPSPVPLLPTGTDMAMSGSQPDPRHLLSPPAVSGLATSTATATPPMENPPVETPQAGNSVTDHGCPLLPSPATENPSAAPVLHESSKRSLAIPFAKSTAPPSESTPTPGPVDALRAEFVAAVLAPVNSSEAAGGSSEVSTSLKRPPSEGLNGAPAVKKTKESE
ncbi:hypothetical protein GSI_13418 [Ganoderma sinense ZZ0214-1]|uniref:Uncharacterized protein n=1 Tax=Ganoderma sinense ZZ0214-1 TaxID=1077348 RepID=A0A2G8RQ86_9APHY|nr:hypothetical protein GSI_13418 [Ganoderma sinense ZZ0214-1]